MMFTENELIGEMHKINPRFVRGEVGPTFIMSNVITGEDLLSDVAMKIEEAIGDARLKWLGLDGISGNSEVRVSLTITHWSEKLYNIRILHG